MDREILTTKIKEYKTEYSAEATFIPRFVDLLKEKNAFLRKNMKRHFTASAWIFNPYNKEVILIHHKKLSKWLQPGGHADGCENLYEVAQKEALEETGIISIQNTFPEIFDIDIHTIPEYKNIPEHDHYDIRFLIIPENGSEIRKNNESNEVRWIKLNEVEKFAANNISIKRMVEKTKSMSDNL